MRAVVCTAYGPPEVPHLRDVAKPVPADDEVLIKVIRRRVGAAYARMTTWLRRRALSFQ